MNVAKDESFEVTLPEITELRLFVRCLNEEAACSVGYETMQWESTVAIPAKESSTFPASNTLASLAAEMTPKFYNHEGDVEVTLRFFIAGSEQVPESVELSAEDLTIKNGVLNGEIIREEENVYRFAVTPVSQSSFAVILPRTFVSVHGYSIRQGLIHGCMYDAEAPYLLNTQYQAGMLDDEEEKTIVVALNEPVTVVSYEGVVQTVVQKEGFINTFAIVVKGTVGGWKRF